MKRKPVSKKAKITKKQVIKKRKTNKSKKSTIPIPDDNPNSLENRVKLPDNRNIYSIVIPVYRLPFYREPIPIHCGGE